jgi:hypothetical protein
MWVDIYFARCRGQYGSNMSHPSKSQEIQQKVSISWMLTTAVRLPEQMKRPERETSITQKENQNPQSFPRFHVWYWSSDNNILCFDTTQYGRMTHCSMTPYCTHYLWDRIMSSRYWSLSSNTMVKGKDVLVYTMKAFRGSTVKTVIICNLSRKYKWVISLMHQLLQHCRRIHYIHWIGGQMGPRSGMMFWIEGKSLAFRKKQTTYSPASRLSPYWLSCLLTYSME